MSLRPGSTSTPSGGPRWTDERVALAVKLWREGKPDTAIMKALGPGFTRNAVAGKLKRLGETNATRDAAKLSSASRNSALAGYTRRGEAPPAPVPVLPPKPAPPAPDLPAPDLPAPPPPAAPDTPPPPAPPAPVVPPQPAIAAMRAPADVIRAPARLCKPVELAELTDHMCPAILRDGLRCGAPKALRASWCDEHRKAFTTAPSKTVRTHPIRRY